MSEHYSSSLAHYFAKMSGSGQALGTAEHIALGADCVRPNDVTNCVELLPEISRKLSALAPESSFRRQVEQMALFVTETQGEVCRRPQREVVFALFYLLNRQDLIPDNVPEFGLLDDAHLVGIAYERNLGELRAHWTAKGRVLKSDGSE